MGTKKIKIVITFIKDKILSFFLFLRQWITIFRLAFYMSPIKKSHPSLFIKQKFYLIYFLFKRMLLALQYKCTIGTIIKHLFFLSVVFCISYIVFSQKDITSQVSASLYACLGFIFSLYATYLYERVVNFYNEIKYLPLIPQILNSVYGMSDAVFKSFFTHPLDDKICKKGERIIYVSPCKAGGGYDENLIMEYTNWMDEMDEETFHLHFNAIKARQLINHLKQQSFYFNNTYLTVLNKQNSIDENLFILFSQFYAALNGFMYLDLFNWDDSQIKQSIFMQTKILINKTNTTILFSQRELDKISRYTNFIASEPIKAKRNLYQNADKIVANIHKETKKHVDLLNSFKKPQQDYIIKKMLSILNFFKIQYPPNLFK